MKEKKVNLDYLNLYQEIPLFCALTVSGLFRKKARGSGVLIVNACLIGEFAASVPAIREYICRHEGVAVDLMVSPPLKPLAERIRGVRNVYVARSLQSRRGEETPHHEQQFPVYDTIFVMRIGRDTFRLLRTVRASAIHTGLRVYSTYALHLWGSLVKRKPPKQWRELNFEMLGGKVRDIPFDDLFALSKSEYESIAHLEALRTEQKKVLIHTGVNWMMKRWSIDKWVALLKKLHHLSNLRFIFIGGTEDADEYARIASKLEFPVYSLIGTISLLQLLLVLRESDYFIGVDSGPGNMAHLADARNTTILGPGPHFFMPWSKEDTVLDKSRGRGLFQMFFYKKNGFIEQITADEVCEACKSLWNS